MSRRPRISAAVGVVLATTSCTLWLNVEKTAPSQETVSEPVGSVERVSAELVGDGLRIAVQRFDRTKVTDYAVVSRTRQRQALDDSQSAGVFVLDFLVPILPLIDIGLGVSAMFRDDVDIALGPLGFLAAVAVPGVTLAKGRGRYEDWDKDTTRRVVREEVVEGEPVGVSTTLNVVTDRDVLNVETDSLGTVAIPLAQLRNASGAFDRITVVYGGVLYAVHVDGGTVSCTPITR